jgi:hypothetical protein
VLFEVRCSASTRPSANIVATAADDPMLAFALRKQAGERDRRRRH